MTIGIDEADSGRVDKKGRGVGVPVTKKGAPAGRPKGSRNKVTTLKLMAEEAVRSNNATKMMEVCNRIVDQALEGDKTSQKLVWQAMVSNGVSDDKAVKERVEIKIGTMGAKKETEPFVTIEGETQ